jgi:hypothetical protein
MRRLTTPMLAALVLAALLAPCARAGASAEVNVDFDEIGAARFAVSRSWDGPDADVLRAEVDRTHGDGDGLFTYPELARFLSSERHFPTGPRGLALDGSAPETSEANVTLEGALGLVHAPQPVAFSESLNATFRDADASRPTHALKYAFDGPAILTIHLPPDWRATETRGFAEAHIREEGRVVEGRGAKGTQGEVVFVRSGALPAGAESQTAPTPGPRNAPAASPALVAASLGALAYLGRALSASDARRRGKP